MLGYVLFIRSVGALGDFYEVGIDKQVFKSTW